MSQKELTPEKIVARLQDLADFAPGSLVINVLSKINNIITEELSPFKTEMIVNEEIRELLRLKSFSNNTKITLDSAIQLLNKVIEENDEVTYSITKNSCSFIVNNTIISTYEGNVKFETLVLNGVKKYLTWKHTK